MLKKTVTYEDFNGEMITEDVYFNLTKAELAELELSTKGGFVENMQKIIAAEDGKSIIEAFKSMLLMSVGKKSEDGKRFIKNDQIRQDFESSGAYSEIFMELATNADAGAAFVNGIVPRDLAQAVGQTQLPIQDVELPREPVGDSPAPSVATPATDVTPDFASMTPVEFEAWKNANA